MPKVIKNILIVIALLAPTLIAGAIAEDTNEWVCILIVILGFLAFERIAELINKL